MEQTQNTLDRTMRGIRSAWGPLDTEVVAACRRHLQDLLDAPATRWSRTGSTAARSMPAAR